MAGGVFLAAVNVSDLDRLSCATEGADTFARRAAFAGVRPVA
jgi:hypothetical protein